jgi:hypothetical protein
VRDACVHVFVLHVHKGGVWARGVWGLGRDRDVVPWQVSITTLREIKILQSMDHRNVVPLLELVASTGGLRDA